MQKKIIPAVIAGDVPELIRMLKKIGDHAPIIQLDVMDGEFVPSKSLDFPLPDSLEPDRFEAHLMITDPDSWMERNSHAVSMIIPHLESLHDPKKTIRHIKKLGKKAGIAMNPETPVDRIVPIIDLIDQVLIMTVNPGFYGSPFLPETLGKITWLREKYINLPIEVDGGIKPGTIERVEQAGANLFVSGSYLLLAEDIGERIDTLKKLAGMKYGSELD